MPSEPSELPNDPKPERKITFTAALLCQQVLRDHRGDLISLINIIDSIALERQPEWVEFCAYIVARSDQTEPFSVDAELSLLYPSGKVSKLPAPEKMGFGTELSVEIGRKAGSKLIVGVRIQLAELGEHTFIVSVGRSVAEIPFTVTARVN